MPRKQILYHGNSNLGVSGTSFFMSLEYTCVLQLCKTVVEEDGPDNS